MSEGRADATKAYAGAEVPFLLAGLHDEVGRVIGRVGDASMTLLVEPETVVASAGAYALILEPGDASPHAACDLIYLPPGAALEGVRRALWFESDAGVSPPPSLWQAPPEPPFAVFEDGDATKPLLRAGFQDAEHDVAVRILVVSNPIPSDLWLATRPALELLGDRLLASLVALCEQAPNAMLSVFGAEMYIAPDLKRLEELRGNVEHAQALELISIDEDGL